MVWLARITDNTPNPWCLEEKQHKKYQQYFVLFNEPIKSLIVVTTVHTFIYTKKKKKKHSITDEKQTTQRN